MELDVAPSVVVVQCLGCILLCIGEDDPEPAAAVDVGVDGRLVQNDLPSPHGRLLDGEVGFISRFCRRALSYNQ